MYKMTLVEIAERMGYVSEKATEAADMLAINGHGHLANEEHTREEWNNIIGSLKEV